MPPSCTECISECVKVFRGLPMGEVELEVRLGSVDETGRFVAGVTREVFDQLEEELVDTPALQADDGYTEVVDYHYALSRGEQARTRVICDAQAMDMQKTHTIKQSRMSVILRRMDDGGEAPSEACRIACASEAPLTDPPGACVPTHVRIKQRRTFRDVRDGDVVWIYELSKTWSAGSRLAVEHQQHVTPPTYEVECELVDLSRAYLDPRTDSDVAASMLLKAQALMGDETDSTEEGLSVVQVKTSEGRKRGRQSGSVSSSKRES